MLLSVEEMVVEIEISRGELERWISERWLLPVEQEGAYFFDEVDRARARLIAELRGELAVNDEAIPVVLRLLDQIYELRRTLGDLQGAIEQLPEATRQEIEALLRKASGP